MDEIERDGLRLCMASRLARRKGRAVRLGDIECRLLAALMRADGVPVSVAALGAELWGAPENAEARVRGVVRRLRTKLPGVRIETIVGEGYRLAPDKRDASPSRPNA